MVVSRSGRAYVGATGYNLMAGKARQHCQIVLFELGQQPTVVSTEVLSPNGIAISEDGRQLVLSETAAQRVSRFEIREDGSLAARETWVELGTACDGLNLDDDGGAWVARLTEGAFVHVAASGVIDRPVEARENLAVACVSVGTARSQLAMCSADTSMADLARGVSRSGIHVTNNQPVGAGVP